MARVLGLAAALLRLPPVPCGRVHTGVPGTGGGARRAPSARGR